MSKIETRFNVYIETYGCQMNQNDSEIAAGILRDADFSYTEDIGKANVIILNTCAVRDNAEQKIQFRINALKFYKKKSSKLIVGIIGCMAERLGEELLGHKGIVNFVVGPDAYRKLPEIIRNAAQKINSAALDLSLTETYSDIAPLRNPAVSAWLSIMRGCNNFCTYCVVPYTRGRERSKPFDSVMNEMQLLVSQGAKEVTLLGQNVNSYHDTDTETTFAGLLTQIAFQYPNIRIRFMTSHPYDVSDEMIAAIAKYDNICNYIHVPVQAGSDRILKAMNRKYTKTHYLNVIKKLRVALPECTLSTDIISGFPTETEEDHQEMLELLRTVRYDTAFMFNYSPRPGTKSHREMEDDVPHETKRRRLSEIIDLQNQISKELNDAQIGKVHEIMVESSSKKNINQWQGRSKTNKTIIFDNQDMKYQAGDFVKLRVEKATSATLFGSIVE